MVGIAISIVVAGFFIMAGICYVGNVLNGWLEQFDQSAMCHLALERTRLRLELMDADIPVPEWLDDAFDEEDDDSDPGTAMKRVGKVIQLHRKSDEEEEKDD